MLFLPVGADCNNGTLTLYVDGQRIDSVSDNTYGNGSIGVFAGVEKTSVMQMFI